MNLLFNRIRRKIRNINIIWHIKQNYYRFWMLFIDRKKIIEELPLLTHHRFYTTLTITFGSRYFENKDNMLENFIKSFISKTTHPQRVEILIKVDLDDNLLFFYKIKQKYGDTVNIRFFPGARGCGYADMHTWHSQLIKNSSLNSKALVILTEDCRFNIKGWEEKLIDQIGNLKIFIGTPVSLEQTIKLLGPNPPGVYWLRGDDYPIISFKLLRITEKVSKKYPDWTCLGNLYLVDSFSASILKIMWEKHNINIHIHTKNYFQRLGNSSWTDSSYRNFLRTNTLKEFFLIENHKIREEMVDKIKEEMIRG